MPPEVGPVLREILNNSYDTESKDLIISSRLWASDLSNSLDASFGELKEDSKEARILLNYAKSDNLSLSQQAIELLAQYSKQPWAMKQILQIGIANRRLEDTVLRNVNWILKYYKDNLLLLSNADQTEIQMLLNRFPSGNYTLNRLNEIIAARETRVKGIHELVSKQGLLAALSAPWSSLDKDVSNRLYSRNSGDTKVAILMINIRSFGKTAEQFGRLEQEIGFLERANLTDSLMDIPGFKQLLDEYRSGGIHLKTFLDVVPNQVKSVRVSTDSSFLDFSLPHSNAATSQASGKTPVVLTLTFNDGTRVDIGLSDIDLSKLKNALSSAQKETGVLPTNSGTEKTFSFYEFTNPTDLMAVIGDSPLRYRGSSYGIQPFDSAQSSSRFVGPGFDSNSGPIYSIRKSEEPK